MHETYLKNEREWDEAIKRVEDIYDTDGYDNLKKYLKNDENKLFYREIYPETAYELDPEKVKSHNRTSLIKVMKALEKELEAMKHDDGIGWSDEIQAYNQALQLAIDKISNFINKIQ